MRLVEVVVIESDSRETESRLWPGIEILIEETSRVHGA
jgi:hypothetical protein